MSVLLYHLAKFPDKQELLRAEVFQILPEINSSIDEESFYNAPYFRACLKESLRMQPIAPNNMRAIGQDLVLDGYRIPKNVSCFWILD